MDRRHFLHTTGSTALSLSLGLNAWSRHELFAASDGTDAVSTSEHPAHGRKRPIRGVTVGDPSPLTESGGDTWVSAWADDNNLYSPSDDTSGFHQAAHSNIAFNKITGSDPLHLSGTTVNPMLDYGKDGQKGPDKCTWKSSGCTCLNGVLYWVVARHMYGEDSGDEYRRQPAHDASIIKSSDYGQTWTRSAQDNYNHPMFPGSRFATPYFIEYGRSAGADNSDQYIYAVSNDGFWDCGNDMILGRVLKSKMASLNGADWEYFRGGDGRKSSAWAPHFNDAKPIVEGTRKWGMTGGVYVPAHGRYLMIGWYYPAGGGKIKDACTHTTWDFYEAPRPWGPWTKIGTHDSSPQGYYSPEICPKFQSAKKVYIFTAGNWNNRDVYHLTVVPLELVV